MNDKHKGPHCAGSCEGAAYLITIRNIEAENARLRAALEEIREVWAGSDGLIPETCPEGYLQRLLKQCYQIAVGALK